MGVVRGVHSPPPTRGLGGCGALTRFWQIQGFCAHRPAAPRARSGTGSAEPGVHVSILGGSRARVRAAACGGAGAGPGAARALCRPASALALAGNQLPAGSLYFKIIKNHPSWRVERKERTHRVCPGRGRPGVRCRACCSSVRDRVSGGPRWGQSAALCRRCQ